jgi:catechol 2,3-dioxygenase-like lactoylglutathione lyase family enzyme
MILGVGQVVLNVRDLEASEAELVRAGYTRTFEERALPNHAAKAVVQGASRAALDMVHLNAPGPTTAVELTSYGDAPTGRAAFEYLAPAQVRAPTADVEASRRFWEEGLGFREADGGTLAPRAMMPAWRLGVLPVPAAVSADETTVDAEGCVLVTVLSTAVDDDLRRLDTAGHLSRSTAAWSETIAGRALRVAIVAGPGGELVELLEVPRTARSANDERES